jgi:hypothetical protein
VTCLSLIVLIAFTCKMILLNLIITLAIYLDVFFLCFKGYDLTFFSVLFTSRMLTHCSLFHLISVSLSIDLVHILLHALHCCMTFMHLVHLSTVALR